MDSVALLFPPDGVGEFPVAVNGKEPASPGFVKGIVGLEVPHHSLYHRCTGLQLPHPEQRDEGIVGGDGAGMGVKAVRLQAMAKAAVLILKLCQLRNHVPAGAAFKKIPVNRPVKGAGILQHKLFCGTDVQTDLLLSFSASGSLNRV